MRNFILFLLCSLCFPQLFAQTTNNDEKQKYVYPQKVSPVGIDNYLFSTYYYNDKKTYNLRNSVLSNSGIISVLKINPAGSSFAIVHAKGKKSNVTVYDLWAANKVTHEFDEDIAPVSFAMLRMLKASSYPAITKNCFSSIPGSTNYNTKWKYLL